MEPTPASARNAPMRPTEPVAEYPVSALTERREKAASIIRRASVIEHGRLLEEQARARLARARARILREETKRSSSEAVELARLRKLEEAARLKDMLAVLHGKDLLEKLEAVPRASPAEMLEFAELFNEHMASSIGRVGPASVNKLFKKMLVPEDSKTWGDAPKREGTITFSDFERVVRHELHLSSATMPQERLLGLWRALDADGNGLCELGEFMRFMRFGNADPTNCRMNPRHEPDAAAPAGAREDASGISTPRRSRLAPQGENPDARAKERMRMRAHQQARERDVQEVKGIYGGYEAKARQLEREASKLEAQLASGARGAGAGMRLPKIA